MKFNSNGDSWWLREALGYEGNPTPNPALQGAKNYDVVIVGGGYVGLWTAILVKQEASELSIAVLESGVVGRNPSGMNGGFMSGYRGYRDAFAKAIGYEAADEVVEAGDIAQREIINFIKANEAEYDVWLSTQSSLLVGTTPRQVQQLHGRVALAQANNSQNIPKFLDQDELFQRFPFKNFLAAIESDGGTTIHPARLVRSLKQYAEKLGVRIYENSEVINTRTADSKAVVLTAHGNITADQVVLATNYRGVDTKEGRSHLTTLSAYALVTEPIAGLQSTHGWAPGLGMRDTRMFLNWFRSTNDNRVVFGSAIGPIAKGSDIRQPLSSHQVKERVIADFRALFGELDDAKIEQIWAGPIDMSSDQMPFVGKRKDHNIYYAYGFSGHGVNAAWIGGRCLASLVLEKEDRWSTSPFVTRSVPWLPPEPLRGIAGQIIKNAVIRIEDALDAGKKPSIIDRSIAYIPKLLNMKIGIRD